jgi:hypothetical protein
MQLTGLKFYLRTEIAYICYTKSLLTPRSFKCSNQQGDDKLLMTTQLVHSFIHSQTLTVQDGPLASTFGVS